MNMNIRWKKVLKKNYPQVLFVFAAFLIMILAGYYFVSGILRNRLLINASNNLFSAEANIRAAFVEAVVTLNTSFPIVLGMIEQGLPQKEILEYLKSATKWIQRDTSRGLMESYGIYGYIRGEFMDSLEKDLGEKYFPQSRPWYQTAVRVGNSSVAYTAPYPDAETGETIISAVKNIIDEEGNYYGILAIDMNMKWITEYIKTLRLGSGGYGMIVSQNMMIMTHPDQSALGKQLQELGKPFRDISRRLRLGEEISTLRYDTGKEGRIITFFKQMPNGWYVGLITPTRTYYRELYYAAYILSSLGFVLMCALSYLLLQINAAKMEADENSLSKSTFLAKMSHEIRTPMNAIIGMSELMLREDLNPGIRNYAGSIRQAGSNLLAIINDILDFSKIESGKIDIINAEYQFASIINDVIAIIRMRLNEKPIRFITKIDGSLPAVLVGDEVRVRQVLLNLLNNAIKYTSEGSIVFSISRKNGFDEPEKVKRDGEKPRIFLSFTVADTGIGIKKEDIEHLFGDFVQFDQKHNRGIEGTGLGLAISRNLCQLMGGNITVKSEYGRGSVFTASIPQFVRDPTPFVRVERPETKTALIYDDRALCAESLIYTIESLKVICIRAHTRHDVIEHVNRVQFVFTSPWLLDEVREILRGRDRSAVPDDPAVILLMEDWQADRTDVQTVSTPLQPVAVANILNSRGSDEWFYEAECSGGRFTAPGVRVLVVDDIVINLDVVQGLLSPYKMTIERATGGLEAVRMVQKDHYDLVLMDHMMPGMDGVEAVAAIRAWEAASAQPTPLPIIALTANAISGMKEMFLEKGFSDYLFKPIEIAKLDEMMARWIPADKRKKNSVGTRRETVSSNSGLSIPGVDVKRGITMTGGTEAGYRKVLAQFCKDVAERLDWFRDFSGEENRTDTGQCSEETISLFIIHVHALKSAAGTIGAVEASAEAAALEAAGKAGEIRAVIEGLPIFCERLTRLTGGIAKALETKNLTAGSGARDAVSGSLAALRAALESKNMKAIDRLLEELEAADAETAEGIADISDKVLMGEYQKAIEIVSRLTAKER
jgi:signal transduction histidine kinase/DNA-binding response OmpR family regulator